MQWYKDGVPLDGKTNATLTISSAQFSDAGDYNLTASNLWGQVVSVSAHLTVLPTFGLTISPVPPNKVIISFSTESGFQYVTETTPDLISGSWSAIATNIGTGLLTTVTNVTTVPASFYRTRVE